MWAAWLLFQIDLLARNVREMETKQFCNMANGQAVLEILAYHERAIVNLTFFFDGFLDMNLQSTTNPDNVKVSIALAETNVSLQEQRQKGKASGLLDDAVQRGVLIAVRSVCRGIME